MTDVDKLYLNMNININTKYEEVYVSTIILNESKFNSWKLLLSRSHRSR